MGEEEPATEQLAVGEGICEGLGEGLDTDTSTNDFEKFVDKPLTQPLLPQRTLFSLSLFWFGYNFCWASLITVIQPFQVYLMLGNQKKALGLGFLALSGAVVSAMAAPIFGTISDRSRGVVARRLGKRLPFVVCGVSIMLVALAGLALTGGRVVEPQQAAGSTAEVQANAGAGAGAADAPADRATRALAALLVLVPATTRRPRGVARSTSSSTCRLEENDVDDTLVFEASGNFLLYTACFMVLQLGSQMASAPYNALLPDVVPSSQYGAASGYMGLMTMLGNACGGMMGFWIDAPLGLSGTFIVLSVVLIAATVATVVFVREPPLPPAAVALQDLPCEQPAAAWDVPVASFSVQPDAPRDGLLPLPAPAGRVARALALARAVVGNVRRPFKSPNFTWVFWTRFLMTIGFVIVQTYIQYYLCDVVGAPFIIFGIATVQTATSATSAFIVPLLVGAVVASVIGGMLSDRLGRKIIVLVSGGMQSLCTLLLGLPIIPLLATHAHAVSFSVLLCLGMVFGMGYGCYECVDFALVNDVLPCREDAAKDMAIWHLAVTIPQVIATPIAAVVLTALGAYGESVGVPGLGYYGIMWMTTLVFVLGTVLIQKVRLPKPAAHDAARHDGYTEME